MSSSLTIVATGSSAVLVLPAYLSEIKARLESDVTVVLTASALRFLSAESIGWFASRVITPDAPGVNPVEVGVRSEALVVLPASGNTVASAALGLMPTTATTVIATSARPGLFFPQMHEVVWRKPLMAAHLESLRQQGHLVVDPERAMGFEISKGRSVEGWSMPGPAKAADMVTAWLRERSG
jgi:phosphopantothenoylcysteine synthetase/decarboxylase